MSAEPRVSVLMPVRNGALFLREALESILAQTFADFELLAIDDGSTDATAELLAEHARRDVRLRVERQDAHGLTATLNRGIALARGSYIARFDADDVALPQRLEKQVRFLDANPGVAGVGSRFESFGGAGRALPVEELPCDPARIRALLPERNCISHPTVVLRRDVLLELGGYRPAFAAAEDYDLWLRITDARALANLEEALVRYRVHPGQASVTRLEQQVVSTLAARRAARIRRATGLDPVHGVDPVTRPVLSSLGIVASEIDEAMVGAFHYKAVVLHRLGMQTAARDTALTLRSLIARGEVSGRRLSRYYLLRFRLERYSERTPRALGWLALALARRPSHAFELARGVLRRSAAWA